MLLTFYLTFIKVSFSFYAKEHQKQIMKSKCFASVKNESFSNMCDIHKTSKYQLVKHPAVLPMDVSSLEINK